MLYVDILFQGRSLIFINYLLSFHIDIFIVVTALNRKTDDIPVMFSGKMNLYYKSSSQMTGSTSVDSKFNECKVLVSAQSVNGTPYTGSNLWNVTGIVSGGKLTIDAWGAGFVSGHVLSVSYLLVV